MKPIRHIANYNVIFHESSPVDFGSVKERECYWNTFTNTLDAIIYKYNFNL